MTLQNVGLFKSRKMLARIATNSSQWSRYLAAVVDTETFLSPISSFDERSYPLKPALDDRLGVALPEVAVEQLERKRAVVADGTEVGNHFRQIGDSVANHDAVVGRGGMRSLLREISGPNLASHTSVPTFGPLLLRRL